MAAPEGRWSVEARVGESLDHWRLRLPRLRIWRRRRRGRKQRQRATDHRKRMEEAGLPVGEEGAEAEIASTDWRMLLSMWGRVEEGAAARKASVMMSLWPLSVH